MEDKVSKFISSEDYDSIAIAVNAWKNWWTKAIRSKGNENNRNIIRLIECKYGIH